MACVTDSAAEACIDRALVARVLLGDDRNAFEQLLRRHQGMVRAQLRRLLQGDAAGADDLAQETFLLAWRKLDSSVARRGFPPGSIALRIRVSCRCIGENRHWPTMRMRMMSSVYQRRSAQWTCNWISSAQCGG